jgi:hypothetical protein
MATDTGLLGEHAFTEARALVQRDRGVGDAAEEANLRRVSSEHGHPLGNKKTRRVAPGFQLFDS